MRELTAGHLTTIAFVLLSACGGERGSVLDNSQQQVMAMGDADRNNVLAQAIRAGRRRCDTVLASRPLEPAGPVPTYVAGCDNGDHFVVFLRPGGKSDVQLTGSDPR